MEFTIQDQTRVYGPEGDFILAAGRYYVTEFSPKSVDEMTWARIKQSAGDDPIEISINDLLRLQAYGNFN